MNYRYIYLLHEYPFSGFGKDFDDKFRYNTWILCNYLSRHVRKLHLPTDGEYNLLSCCITKEKERVRIITEKCLCVSLHVSEEEINAYQEMRDEHDRFEYYFSLLERGYRLASQAHEIPIDEFLKLHQMFRDAGYKNEWLFKKKMLHDYGIKVILEHVLTSYAYHLKLTVTDMKGLHMNSGYIFTTYPDDIFFNKEVRHLVITDNTLLITDFLNHPQIECQLDNLTNGIIKSKCLNENTKLYIPNEQNFEDFEKLKWK